jgi:hypothetical protein
LAKIPGNLNSFLGEINKSFLHLMISIVKDPQSNSTGGTPAKAEVSHWLSKVQVRIHIPIEMYINKNQT